MIFYDWVCIFYFLPESEIVKVKEITATIVIADFLLKVASLINYYNHL